MEPRNKSEYQIMSLEREMETILKLKDNMFLVQCSMIHCQIDVAFQWVSQDFEPHPGGRDHGFQVWGRHGPLPTSFSGGWPAYIYTLQHEPRPSLDLCFKAIS